MDHLAQDLTIALEESESCGPITLEPGNISRRWGIRRRTRSAGNLSMIIQNLKIPDIYANNKSGDNQSEDSSSTTSEVRGQDKKHWSKKKEQHHSDSDDTALTFSMARAMNTRSQSLRMKHNVHPFFRGRYNKLGMSHSLESDSFNENSPARPNLRRKRKLKRMSIDETPITASGKRKRPHRFEIVENGRTVRYTKIKPLNQTVVDKIERFCQPAEYADGSRMETQYEDNCDVASESSLSWSGGEGHEGDDELTDWAPAQENSSMMDPNAWNDSDAREMRAGCRRLRQERPGFTVNTGANERVAKFLQDSTKWELRLIGTEHDKLVQLATLYSLDLWPDGNSYLLRKTIRTPCMQPPQRHHRGQKEGHKRVRTQDQNELQFEGSEDTIDVDVIS